MTCKKLIIPLCLFLYSCTPQMYFPDRVNSPALRERGEAKITASVKLQGLDEEYSNDKYSPISPALDAAYALTDHFAVMGSYRGIWNTRVQEILSIYPDYKDTIPGGRLWGARYEAAAGYYTTYRNSKAGEEAEGGLMELFGGVSWGSVNRESKIFPTYSYDANYCQLHLQYGVGMYKEDIFRMIGGVKAIVAQFYRVDAPNEYIKYSMDPDPNREFNFTKRAYLYLQPFWNVEVGGKYLKLSAQMNLLIATSQTGGRLSGGMRGSGSLGAVFNYMPGMFK